MIYVAPRQTRRATPETGTPQARSCRQTGPPPGPPEAGGQDSEPATSDYPCLERNPPSTDSFLKGRNWRISLDCNSSDLSTLSDISRKAFSQTTELPFTSPKPTRTTTSRIFRPGLGLRKPEGYLRAWGIASAPGWCPRPAASSVHPSHRHELRATFLQGHGQKKKKRQWRQQRLPKPAKPSFGCFWLPAADAGCWLLVNGC